MQKEVITHDFAYHERTVKKMYETYYKKLIINLFVLLFLEIGMLVFWGVQLLTIGLTLLLGCAIFFFVKKYQEFPDFYKKVQSQVKKVDFTEDGNYYYLEEEDLKFSKKNTRNLMSQDREITFFVGVSVLNVMEPITVCYYDHLEMAYTEEYKLSKNKVNFRFSRWRYRLRSWLRMLPLVLIVGYILFFRLPFIWQFINSLFK